MKLPTASAEDAEHCGRDVVVVLWRVAGRAGRGKEVMLFSF